MGKVPEPSYQKVTITVEDSDGCVSVEYLRVRSSKLSYNYAEPLAGERILPIESIDFHIEGLEKDEDGRYYILKDHNKVREAETPPDIAPPYDR